MCENVSSSVQRIYEMHLAFFAIAVRPHDLTTYKSVAVISISEIQLASRTFCTSHTSSRQTELCVTLVDTATFEFQRRSESFMCRLELSKFKTLRSSTPAPNTFSGVQWNSRLRKVRCKHIPAGGNRLSNQNRGNSTRMRSSERQQSVAYQSHIIIRGIAP